MLLNIQGMPIKNEVPGIVDDGAVDSMLWAGLMCASGDFRSVGGIKNCQTQDGRLWRSPDHVLKQQLNSFSRDMALGFLLYVSATNDFVMLRRWLSYLRRNNTICPDANDGRCIATKPLGWQIDYIVYGKTSWLLKPYLIIAALTAPLGYQLHLVGVHLLLGWLITKKRGTLAGKILHKRQPLNPFFQWLADVTVIIPEASTTSRCTQWAWERADSECAWKESMGWDYLFIRNLINRDLSK